MTKKTEESFRNVEGCIMNLGFVYNRACDNALGYFASERGLCDQEGCSEHATVFLKRKKEFCSGCGEAKDTSYRSKPDVRQFCAKHSTRGDSCRDDCDDNYESPDSQPPASTTEEG